VTQLPDDRPCHDQSVEMTLRVLAVLVGTAAVLAVLTSVLKTTVVPRSTSSVITRFVFLVGRRVFDVLAPESMPFERRDRVLAYYAPVMLLTLPGVWITILIGAFTLLYWGTGLQPLSLAFEASGSSLTTLGFVKPDSVGHQALAFVEAAMGLGVIALLISFLPSLYAGFNRREVLVGMLEWRAGRPPSPGVLILRYRRIGGLGVVEDDLVRPWEAWFADVEESHTSFPAMVFFRSPIGTRSWITSAGCVLDSVALLLSTVDVPNSPRGAVMLRNGFFCLRRVADGFGLPYDADPAADDPISVTREEWDVLVAELEADGVPLKPDRERAWRDFAGWRVNYDSVLLQLAALVVAPPAQWSSDRLPPRPRPRLVRRGSRPPGTAPARR